MVTPKAMETRFQSAQQALVSSDDLGKQADKQLAAAETIVNPGTAPVVDGEDPRDKREYGFDFSWKDGRGKPWVGRFENRILNLAQRQSVGILESSYNGGMPYSSVSTTMQVVNHALAHMHYSLSKKTRPEWAQDLRMLDNPALLLEIYEEVLGHEDRFLGVAENPSEGKSAS